MWAGEARNGEAFDVVEYGMDVEALAPDRARSSEKDSIRSTSLHDPVGLLADELSPAGAVVVAGRALQQLRRAANAGEPGS